MADVLDRNFDFATNGTVTAAGLHSLIDNTDIYAGLISTQEEKTTVGTADLLLVADSSSIGSPQIAPNRTTVYNLFDDALTGGTYANAQLSGNLTYGTATGQRTISTSATITTGTIATLNSTTGTIATLNSTTGTIATLNSTTGTIATLNSTTPTFLGAITASTNTINVGSGQIYKDAGGNVGIGVSSPISSLHLKHATPTSKITLEDSSSNRVGQIAGGSDGAGGLLTFSVGNNGGTITEYLRIDSSGNLLVGKTSPSTSTVGFQFDLANQKISSGANGGSTAFFTRNGDNGSVVQIARDGVEKGTISVTTTAVAYNTSSDYRLKTNLEPISNGIERIKQLPVYRFNWKIDEGGNKVDGFVAHEAKAIVPECVSGEKDAVDSDGKPIHQGIDQSKIVPLLTAALKEAIAKIETLEAKVAALEAA